MPSKNSVKISISLEAKTYSSHIFPQKENSTQNPESNGWAASLKDKRT